MAHVPAERCLGIIELLGDGASEMPLGEIAERLALPKSGAHRLLATLVDLGWVEQARDTAFGVGVDLIDKIELDDGVWEVKGHDKFGHKIKLEIDAASGEVVELILPKELD